MSLRDATVIKLERGAGEAANQVARAEDRSLSSRGMKADIGAHCLNLSRLAGAGRV